MLCSYFYKMIFKFLFVVLLVFLAFNSYSTAFEISQDSTNLSAVNISIEARVNKNGRWESNVNVDNGSKIYPKHIVNIHHDVNDSGITFLSNIDDVYKLRVTCSQNKKVDMIEKLQDNYIYKPNMGFYKYHEIASTWNNAWKTCLKENAYLVIVNSEEESKMLASLISPMKPIPGVADYVNYYIHIGFHDFFSEGEYYTILGTPLSESGFFKWGQGQPDNAGNNENCGSFHRTGVLNDIGCTLTASFVCEKDLN